jgi:NDP-sugar pyrophosphorylase family protein
MLFLGRCHLRPSGQQILPGVWAEEAVEIGRGARIVAPAYLGSGSTIRENTLITRVSNIESRPSIDDGTAMEDTSVLADTYVGIWLDVRRAVVQRNKLLHLKRNLVIEIADPSLIRSNVPHREDG